MDAFANAVFRSRRPAFMRADFYLDTVAKLTSLKENVKFYDALFSESGFDRRS